jgi:N-acetylmuramoyl-L-alanine amidase
MPRVAQHAAHIHSASLQDRGYKVRVGKGDPDDNVERSNSWNADRHIPMHSNASGSAQCGGSGRGTRVFYYPGSTKGEDLARKLKNKVGEVCSCSSPGSPDSISTNSSFYELTRTNAKTAYLEAEFHDWWGGVNWLVDYETWSWLIGFAVDEHLGYP